MKTFTFKPEFEGRLKRLRVKEKFIRNIRQEEGRNWVNYCNVLNRMMDWYLFISNAFIWKLAPETEKFWIKIARDESDRGKHRK